MIIDVHIHPVLFGPICTDSDRVNFRKKAFGLYKSSPVPMEQVMAVMDHAGVDRAVILAEDYSASMGQPIVSNEEVKNCFRNALSALPVSIRERNVRQKN